MTNSKTKQLAIITGGTKGLGLAIAEMLAPHYNLALIYLSDNKAAEAAEKKIADAFLQQCDITHASEVENAVKRIKEHFQTHCSVLINCAGIAVKDLFLMENPADHRKTFETNYFGAVNVIRSVLPDMARNKYGRIVSLSTNNVSINNRGSGAYCASKAALEKFCEILGGEVARSGITVNLVRPGMVETQMSASYLSGLNEEEFKSLTSPNEKLISAVEVARAVKFLVESEHINSSIITVDSGHALFRKV